MREHNNVSSLAPIFFSMAFHIRQIDVKPMQRFFVMAKIIFVSFWDYCLLVAFEWWSMLELVEFEQSI